MSPDGSAHDADGPGGGGGPRDDGRSIVVPGEVVAGHGVASGRSGDPRFPDGTIALQLPRFAERDLDLSGFHPATINVSIAPARWDVVRADHTFREVAWHPTEPAEDFSFVAITLVAAGTAYPAMVYHPHPETKPDHVQPDDVVEVMASRIDGLAVGDPVRLQVDPTRIHVTPDPAG